jgi:hypothetical protein
MTGTPDSPVTGTPDSPVTGTPDSPIKFSGLAEKTQERPVRGVLQLEHQTMSGAPHAAPIMFCSNRVEFSKVIFFVCLYELYVPEKISTIQTS